MDVGLPNIQRAVETKMSSVFDSSNERIVSLRVASFLVTLRLTFLRRFSCCMSVLCLDRFVIHAFVAACDCHLLRCPSSIFCVSVTVFIALIIIIKIIIYGIIKTATTIIVVVIIVIIVTYKFIFRSLSHDIFHEREIIKPQP